MPTSLPAAAPVRMSEPVLAAAAAAVAVATIVLACGGLDVLNGRPVKFAHDAVFHYSLAKTVLDNGWTWQAPRLGAPFGFDMLSFGYHLPLESAIMRLLALVTDDCVALLNRTWLVLCGLSAAGGYAAFRLLGLPQPAAFACGCLFATTPHVFFRSVSHFNLHVAFLPVPAAAVLLVLADRLRCLDVRGWLAVLTACLVAGLGFVYHAFFLTILFVHALVIAWLTGRTGSLRRGAVCLGLVAGGAALNMVPVVSDWLLLGKPAELDYRTPEQADLFSLRIRDLILPSEFTPVPGLRSIGRRVAKVAWPLPTESRFAKLGTIAAIGFVICLWVLAGVRPPGDPRHVDIVRAAAAMTLVLVVVGVMGGFGSIFNLFVSPTIRCYNRVAPLLAFLALIPCGSLLHSIASKCGTQLRAAAAMAVVLAFGLVEQNTAEPIRAAATDCRTERAALEAFVRTIERDATPGAAVLMLPATPFPHDHGCGSMRPYDHAKAYLFSRHLRWSWPVYGERQRATVESLGPMSEPGFVLRAHVAGFVYAWIDRHGADADAIEAALTAGGGRLIHADDSGRYRFYTIPEPDHDG